MEVGWAIRTAVAPYIFYTRGNFTDVESVHTVGVAELWGHTLKYLRL